MAWLDHVKWDNTANRLRLYIDNDTANRFFTVKYYPTTPKRLLYLRGGGTDYAQWVDASDYLGPNPVLTAPTFQAYGACGGPLKITVTGLTGAYAVYNGVYPLEEVVQSFAWHYRGGNLRITVNRSGTPPAAEWEARLITVVPDANIVIGSVSYNDCPPVDTITMTGSGRTAYGIIDYP
jgi:hypothetical protein